MGVHDGIVDVSGLHPGQSAISVFMAVEDYEPFKEKVARRT